MDSVSPATSALQPSDAWRVAVLSQMNRAELERFFAGEPERIAPWVMAAAARGLTEGQICLGRMLLAGEGIERDERAAFRWFEKAATGAPAAAGTPAAAKDNAEAHNMLGRCHEQGWGTAVDKTRAAAHFARAAAADHPWAHYNLGHLLLDGDGVARNLSQAFRHYARAAELGHVRAMNLLARCYEEGWGTLRDKALAHHWYRRSAQGGYFRGAYNYASVLAATGCREGARWWFVRALKTAPERSRANMKAGLAKSADAWLRRLAQGV